MLKLHTTRGLVLIISIFAMVAGCRDQVDSAPPAPVKPLEMLSVDGVGPLNAKTPFNLHLLTDAFQAFNVTQQTNFVGGNQYPVITVSKDLKPVLTINPDAKHDKIFSVMVQDNLIGNQLGHPLGSKFSDIYAYGKTEKCAAGSEELSGKVLCYAPKAVNILYLFSGSWNGAKGQVPPKDVLANWNLESILWKPLPRK